MSVLVLNKTTDFVNNDMKVVVVNTLDQIRWLETEWRQLELRANNKLGAFQSYDWNLQWCENWFEPTKGNFPADQQPYIVCLYEDKKLVSIWPLQIEFNTKVKTVSWLSAPAMQYGGVLVDPNSDVEAGFAVVWKHLTRKMDADLLRLENLAEGSDLHRFLSKRCASVARTVSSILKISELGSWENYQAGLKNTARRARRKRYHKLARQGSLEFNVHGDALTFSRLAKTAVGWKNAWLKERNWPSLLMGNKQFSNFLSQLATSQSNNATFDPEKCIWVAGELSLDDSPVAIEVGAVYQGRYFSFLGSFDADYARFSPGKIEMELMIEWAFENDVKEFDFLSVPSQYKSDWTNKTIGVEGFTYSCSLRGKLFHSVWVKRLRPAAKYGLSRLPASLRKVLMSVLEKLGRK